MHNGGWNRAALRVILGPMRLPLRSFPKLLFLAAAIAALPAQAQERFWATVPAEERAACGVAKLSDAQQAKLGELIQRDLDAARQGGVTGFARTFMQRRTAKEVEECGLKALSENESSKIDALVASAMARGGRTMATASLRSYTADDSFEAQRKLGSVHGSVSFVVGTSGGGRNFYGAATDVSYTDPSGKTTTSVGYSYLKGRGCYYPYDPRFERAPYWYDRWY